MIQVADVLQGQLVVCADVLARLKLYGVSFPEANACDQLQPPRHAVSHSTQWLPLVQTEFGSVSDATATHVSGDKQIKRNDHLLLLIMSILASGLRSQSGAAVRESFALMSGSSSRSQSLLCKGGEVVVAQRAREVLRYGLDAIASLPLYRECAKAGTTSIRR